jgi:ribose transport system permease protein
VSRSNETWSSSATAPVRSSAARRALTHVLAMQATVPAVTLVALVLLVGLTHPAFFSGQAVEGNIRVAALTAITACGMVFLLAMGEIDISVGGIFGVCFILAGKLAGNAGVDIYLAAVIAIGCGAVMGLANGIFVYLFRAPAIIVTLGTFSLYAGLVQVIYNNEQVGTGLPVESSFFTVVGGNLLGVPVTGWVALVVMIVLTIILTRSRPGAMIRAAGSNRAAAEFSGIPVARLRTYCLMLTGALAGLAGVLNLAYQQGGDSTVGTGYELKVIAAAIIGGTAITGGSGSVPGALIGALLVWTITSGLVFFNVNPLWSDVVTGIVILVAVGAGTLLAHRRAERLARLDAEAIE